ncbi:MAG: hypothetical protein U9Q96_01850 [Patescibacteria group bacterium]|nr:hypothetical protein [Patescibacteria group bacterium]
MEEKQIISQLKGLKQITPDNRWKEDAKSHILGTIQPRESIFSGVFSMPSFKMPHLQPAMILPVLMVLFVGAGIFTHFYLGSSEEVVEAPYKSEVATYLVLAETRLAKVQNLEDMEAISEMLSKATDSLPDLSKDPVETAKVVESLANINKKVEELGEENMEGIEELTEKASVLTAKTTEVLEDNIKNTTIELVESLIKSLEKTSLTEKQEELFKEIKLDYNNENYEQAWEKILTLTNE